MLLGADPYVTVTPFAKLPQLLYLRMRMLLVVLDWQPLWIVHTNVTTKAEQYSTRFVTQ